MSASNAAGLGALVEVVRLIKADGRIFENRPGEDVWMDVTDPDNPFEVSQ